ncbi:polysaccharide biosynthesis protein [Photobacterium damselae subsp. piscicida]|uniref:Oligosaccharide flippase family protein n=1 Tax=Photobacterium damsela subsp. piscicida TaxID=38294 RepID=A0A1Q9GVP4_PHODP|nr:oligosaccharide flippase family protein [Photobacterium damselae]MBE8127290.1 oligosaccharide flippase family protein [Photobacterium damselae subsp. piscicida]MDP2515311.1 oligosaccharide flippase family protein [Photobacterium damselae subsp. piscicida]MDP2531363.1 oligosaccharide flippase family protein [Photobacterium damselae subsp. piscicida]MDP2543748.1 oligosaccharide flippase family protein [Photobacterium damselae subsp. piscicida]MDP2556718.1 oligosaccharide flippase family prote
MRLIKGASIYLTSNILISVIPFLLLPVLTRYLTQAEYGQIAMYQTLLSGMGAFIGLNAVGAANRKYFDVDNSEQILKEFNGSCVQICVVSSLIVGSIAFIFREQLSELLSIPYSWIMNAIIVSAFGFLSGLRLGQWQNRSMPVQYGVFQISQSLLNMVLSLVLVVALTQGAKGRIDAQLITGVAFSLIALVLLYKDDLISFFTWRPTYIKEALSFGVPLIPHHLGFFLMGTFDRIIINDKLGLESAGIYMVAFQLSTAMSIIYDAINKAYVPWLFGILKRNDEHEKRKVVKITYLHFGLSLLMASVAFLIGEPIITLVVGESYRQSGEIVGWFCLGQAFSGMYLMVTNYVFYSKKTKFLSIITIGSGIINVSLLMVLMNYFGLKGAVISFATAKLIQFVATWILANRCYKMSWI